jgi:hypothetical protein
LPFCLFLGAVNTLQGQYILGDWVVANLEKTVLESCGPEKAPLKPTELLVADRKSVQATTGEKRLPAETKHPSYQNPLEDTLWEISTLTSEGSLYHNAQTEKVLGRGGIKVLFSPNQGQKGTFLVANQLHLNYATGQIIAEGNVRIDQGRKNWEANFLEYNFKNREFSKVKFEAQNKQVLNRSFSNLPVQNDKISNHLIITRKDITTPASPQPSSSFTTKEMSLPSPQIGLNQHPVSYAEQEHKTSSLWHERRFRFSFEEINMPDPNEHMGLYGFGVHEQFKPWLYGGLSTYGAATGQRGGFFTGGYTLGTEYQLTDRWALDAGTYVGAGGGGSAAQGGGLMLRPHIGLKYDFDRFSLGLNYSYIDFPNGDISSSAIALNLDFPFSSVHRDWNDPAISASNYFGADWDNISRHRSQISARFRAYQPSNGSKTTSGGSIDDTIGLVGVEYSYFLDDQWFVNFETAGAMNGGVAGYAELLGGIGYRMALTADDRLALMPGLSLGGAGGGEVDTGGGLVARANVGLEYRLSPKLSLILDGGYLTAPDGNFDVPYVGFNLAYVTETYAQDQLGQPLAEESLINTTKWRLRPVHQWYLDAQRTGTNSRDMELMGAKIDWMGGDWWYLTGQGLSAYAGGAGGYSEGHWGGGIFGPSWKQGQLYGEMLIGAGGGGGVDSGDGLLYKPSIGLEYNLSENFAIQAGIGKVISSGGNLDSTFMESNLVWRFGTAGR